MRGSFRLSLIAALALLGASPALAQATYPTAAGNVRVPGTVPLQCNASGANCAPSTLSNPTQSSIVSSGSAIGSANGLSDGVGAGLVALSVIPYNLTYNGTAWDRVKKPSAYARLLSSAATTNSTLVKGSLGDLFQIRLHNLKASAVYLKLYNKATAPTCGTDTPVLTYYVPPSAPFEVRFDTPAYFSLGIGYCITGAAADADTTALLAGDVVALNVAFQ